MDHTPGKCDVCVPGKTCPLCSDDTLCVVCKSFNDSRPTTCPGVPMSKEHMQQVFDGKLDYTHGQWEPPCWHCQRLRGEPHEDDCLVRGNGK